MRKKSIRTTARILFILSVLPIIVNIRLAITAGSTIIVPDHYERIQWAIGNATSGDTIFVRNGTYYEHLLVSKSLTLIGESKESTIIDGSGENNTVLQVTAGHVVVKGFTVQNTSRIAGTSYAGIKVSGNACNITNNIATKNKIGIFVTSQSCRVIGNVAKGNGQGIALYSSSEARIEANNVSVNTVGISLALSHNNTIIGNRATNSSMGGHGITLSSDSFNNSISNNDLSGNYHGMWLSGSFDNLIINNTITDNELLGIELANSSNNTMYHNNFINNPKHIVIDDKSIGVWDSGYPFGGNFWDDFPGIDENGDNIGDTPYVVSTNNQDAFPLITPIVWNYVNPIPIVWEGEIYLVSFSSNSTIAAFRFNQPQKRINFNVTGQSSTIGFCNVTVPKSLLDDNPWVITVNSQPPIDIILTDNPTHSFLYFTYIHESTSKVTIQGTSVISEFPTFSVQPIGPVVVVIVTGIVFASVFFWKRKGSNKRRRRVRRVKSGRRNRVGARFPIQV